MTGSLAEKIHRLGRPLASPASHRESRYVRQPEESLLVGVVGIGEKLYTQGSEFLVRA